MLYPIFFYIVFASAGFLVDKRLQGAYSYEFEASLCCHSHSVLQRALTVPLSTNFIDYFYCILCKQIQRKITERFILNIQEFYTKS